MKKTHDGISKIRKKVRSVSHVILRLPHRSYTVKGLFPGNVYNFTLEAYDDDNEEDVTIARASLVQQTEPAVVTDAEANFDARNRRVRARFRAVPGVVNFYRLRLVDMRSGKMIDGEVIVKPSGNAGDELAAEIDASSVPDVVTQEDAEAALAVVFETVTGQLRVKSEPFPIIKGLELALSYKFVALDLKS